MTENVQLLENNVLERLNAGTTVREFLRAAIMLLAARGQKNPRSGRGWTGVIPMLGRGINQA